jgi:hypothetical protein
MLRVVPASGLTLPFARMVVAPIYTEANVLWFLLSERAANAIRALLTP